MVIKEKELNHICQNTNCTKGENGSRKHYYACDYCDVRHAWRSIACSFECYQEIVSNRTISEPILPNRIDKTEEEVKELMNTPIDEVKEKTLEDLSDYADVIEESGIAGAIEIINEKIDNKAKAKNLKIKTKQQ